MIIHPELRALRGDDAPQRAAQARLTGAANRWRAQDAVGEVLSDIDAFATCRPLAECTALAALFDETAPAARDLACSLVEAMVPDLRAAPLGHVPLRHFTDGVQSLLLLARSGNVSLSLVALDGDGLAAKPPPRTVDFAPNEMWEHVLAGSGSGALVECRSSDDSRADLRSRALDLFPGKVICRDCDRQSLQITRVEGRLVSLRLQRRRQMAGVTREYSVDDGSLVHLAAGNPRDSRVELMVSLLGRMGRGDGAPAIAGIARGEGTAALRWQALRECLALDTRRGFGALADIARRDDDELAQPARALHAQLLDSYPQLAEIA